MNEEIKMKLGVALVLDEVVNKILYSVITDNGQKVVVDRELPFSLRYALNKDKMMFDKDAELFNQQRTILVAKYGEPSEDGKNVEIKDPEKLELYKKEIGELVEMNVTHSLHLLDPADVDLIKDPDIYVSPDAMTMFIAYLTNDPELAGDIGFNVTVSSPETSAPEEAAVKTDVEETKPAESQPSESKPVETEKSAEEKPVAKKTSASTKKTGTTSKKSSTTKKTTKKAPVTETAEKN